MISRKEIRNQAERLEALGLKDMAELYLLNSLSEIDEILKENSEMPFSWLNEAYSLDEKIEDIASVGSGDSRRRHTDFWILDKVTDLENAGHNLNLVRELLIKRLEEELEIQKNKIYGR